MTEGESIMYEVIQVKLGEAGRISYFSTNSLKFKIGDIVVVEQERGLTYGDVVSEPEMVLDDKIEKPLRKVIRIATPGDKHQIDRNKKRIKDIVASCQDKIKEHKLDMKLIEAEYSFDRSKITFYFTAEGRIDFRDLVKDLAKQFKARIELKQIGVRDEAKMLGGFGPCGMKLCCARFLRNFEPVTIKMAKEQNLPLNPTKISGLCGRLMCCLGYEHKAYKDLMEGLPKEGSSIKTKQGKGKVISVNALKRAITVELQEGRIIEITYEPLNKKK